jgi:uncharacterized protein DUF6636
VTRRLLLIATVVAALALPASALASHTTYFKTPSGNIRCAYFGPHHASVRCDILQTDNAPAKPKPANCPGDWGHSFSVGKRGHGRWLCAGDSVFKQGERSVHYGHRIKRYGITCRSKTSGLRCTNRHHHGFFLSRSKQRVF